MKRLLMEEPTMLELSVQKGHTLTICGDTHGISFSKILITNHERTILRCFGDF